ncbi:hypothetical protein AB0393_13015 [Streptomyces cyaneofuscatus]|uniref:hypothetical protein n=1 Tax=Streptomyces TaxID=1883 RepID=UPI0022420182|nr:hypothetical protein [Streptomyces sp. VB1]UZI28012.1 hypothetical protein OH133_07650 [Streptomyces sp. VB1]
MFVMRGFRLSAVTAVVAVVLAALVHMLACAHGPEFGRAAGSDSLPVAAVAATAVPAPGPVSGAAVGEQGLRFSDCMGVDEPSVLTREAGAAPAPDAVAAVGAMTENERPAAAGRGAAAVLGPPGDHGGQRRVRAVLGVWRT